jgi:transglutaminase-like putative cysteine protease
MLIRLGYDMQFDLPAPVSFVAMLHVHTSRVKDLREPDILKVDPEIPLETYVDSFSNICTRFDAPAGSLRLSNRTLIEDSGETDPVDLAAVEHPIHELPSHVLEYLLSSRYCEVDRLSNVALDLFGHLSPGWSRVQAICDWVHNKVVFGYQYARPTKTALDVFIERQGVCRDYQHLAITFCRALNIPTRYATGYLGDIRITLPPAPMDFSAWFEVYLSGRWWAFDARNNTPRVGRILMAVGRDASDVALTTSFGTANLTHFFVVSDEVPEPKLPGG